MKKLVSILFKKLDNSNYQDPNNLNNQISPDAIEINTKSLDGNKLFYDNEGNICVAINV